jgi:hypothetical protein
MNLNRFSKVELRLSAFLGAVVIASSIGFLSGCGSSSVKEHYVSPQVQGETAKINLDEVQKAFWDTRGSDLNTWMAAFEKRVNEIYEGKEVISIDATREKGHLVVTGYFDTQKKQGFVAKPPITKCLTESPIKTDAPTMKGITAFSTIRFYKRC